MLAGTGVSYERAAIEDWLGRGNQTAPMTNEPLSAEGQRLAPDGFGGKKCTGAVKGVAARALDNVGLAPAASPPPPPKAAASAPPAPAPQKASSFEDMVTNSIAQKEAVLGRTLSEAEKAQLVSKLKALLQ